MYGEIFCRVYNAFGWNYYPEIFGQQLLQWLHWKGLRPARSLDLACGTGVLCRLMEDSGMESWGMDLSEGMIAVAKESGGSVHYDVADMTLYRPDARFNLVTCTGDSFNHISSLSDLEKVFRNIFDYLEDGGWLVFDLLRESEVSDSEPFESPWGENGRIWFQMTRPGEKKVLLTICYYEDGQLRFTEEIRETLHDPYEICALLRSCGFREVTCADRLLDDSAPGTTWFVTARKGV